MPKKAKNTLHKHWMNQVDDRNLGASIRQYYRELLVKAGYSEYEQSTDGQDGKKGAEKD